MIASEVMIFGTPVPMGALEEFLKPYHERQMAASTDLDGATDRGAPYTFPADAGEFAARWNAKTEEQRTAFVQAMTRASEKASLCAMLHDGRTFV